MQSFIQRNRILLLHVSFWGLYFSFFYYQVSSPKHGEEISFFKAFIDSFVQVGFVMLAAYTNYFFFLPRFLKDKNWLNYLVQFSVFFIVLMICFIWTKRYVIQLFYAQFMRMGYFSSQMFVVQVTMGTLFIVIFIGMLRFAEDWFELEAKKKEVENEKLMAELRFLKAQINPHFLFNTLNNLYYLAFTQSPNTTEVIAKLSQMMRYMIYDSNHPKVLLSKELEYMENYISLEKLRLNDQIPIEFEVKGHTNEVLIVPLILITFLENAFKHGVSNNVSNAYVKVNLTLDHKNCIYSVENSKLPPNTSTLPEKSGIGLQNLQRRLELSYPDKYELEIRDQPLYYAVTLKLQL